MVLVDHISDDITDDSAGNLREATSQQNGANSRLSVRNTSGIKGVYLHQGRKKWMAYITINQHMRALGYFHNIHDAAAVVARVRAEVHGDFACDGYRDSPLQAAE